jgi:hypothetical protein
MFNDKLVMLTYTNTMYQSKFKLLAIVVTILACKQHTLTAYACLCFDKSGSMGHE